MPDLRRYDRFGWDYRLVNPLTRREVDWYLRHARETGGPALELACGSGALLAEFAKAGHEVTGLDLSEGMLARARDRVAALAWDVRRRVELVRGDMSEFDLERRFALVVIADNSFRELPDREALSRCLACVRRHLKPGGRLLVTESRLDPDRLHGDWPWSEPREDPRTGALVQRKIRVRVDEEAMRLHGVMTYRVTRPDGSSEELELPFEGPVLEVCEYFPLFREAGFEPTLHVGYEERKDDGRERTLNFTCSKKEERCQAQNHQI